MKLLLIITGGTILSQKKSGTLIPEANRSFAAILENIKTTETEIFKIFSKDSTNINPDDWLLIAEKICKEAENFDAFLIIHGTDTIAYTASALSFLLGNFPKPVLLTGSMIPAGYNKSDAEDNIKSSVAFIEELIKKEINTIAICFNRKLMLGVRTKKYNSIEADAFKSVLYKNLGTVIMGKASLAPEIVFPKRKLFNNCEFKFKDFKLEKNIFPLKLVPGFSQKYLDKIISLKPGAILIESFGAGGVPFIGEDIIPSIKKATENGIIVAVTSQCFEGGVDLTKYEVGWKAMNAGALSAEDMTFESAFTKLMWLLPRFSHAEVRQLYVQDFCGEIGTV